MTLMPTILFLYACDDAEFVYDIDYCHLDSSGGGKSLKHCLHFDCTHITCVRAHAELVLYGSDVDLADYFAS